VSVSNTGAQGKGYSAGAVTQSDGRYAGAVVSANGRYVAFISGAANLVPGDTNTESDVFVRDRRAGTTTRVSVSNTGAQANGYSYEVAVSANGRYVAFDSNATNLVPGDTNDAQDVFVRDRRAGTTTRVSVSNSGAQGNGGSGDPAVSANGRYVAFNSFATNLVPGDTNDARDVFVRDRVD
ncbi:MAG: TolB family protein, partial [Frankiaceae bacterium]